jgi:ADP-ribosylglycohydrolase
METLLRIDFRLRTLMRAARPDPGHPSQATRRFAGWDEYAATVSFPADTAVPEALDDRIRAGWLAQLVGAAAGTAIEGYTADAIVEAFGPIRAYPREPNTYNDDITFEIAYLEAFEAKGPYLTSTDIAEAWTAMIPAGWSAEEVALQAIRRGVRPPDTGRIDNPFDEWIGAQMRGTMVGMLMPGRAREAARLAWADAEVSHAGNGILGEVFNAVLAARAVVEPDPRRLLEEAIALMPPDTEYGRAVRFALSACERSTDWRSAWDACDAQYREYNWIHVLPNACAQVVGLWWGSGDFDRTLEVICGVGHDVDCNAAQMLCVLALGQGSSCIDARWSEPLLRGDVVTYMRRPAAISFVDLCDRTVAAARRWSST